MGEFQVGDRVRIVDEPNEYCQAGWAHEMDQYCGKEATVTRANKWCMLDIDGGCWSWSPDIITKVSPELPDLDPIPPDALQILFGCGGEG